MDSQTIIIMEVIYLLIWLLDSNSLKGVDNSQPHLQSRFFDRGLRHKNWWHEMTGSMYTERKVSDYNSCPSSLINFSTTDFFKRLEFFRYSGFSLIHGVEGSSFLFWYVDVNWVTSTFYTLSLFSVFIGLSFCNMCFVTVWLRVEETPRLPWVFVTYSEVSRFPFIDSRVLRCGSSWYVPFYYKFTCYRFSQMYPEGTFLMIPQYTPSTFVLRVCVFFLILRYSFSLFSLTICRHSTLLVVIITKKF